MPDYTPLGVTQVQGDTPPPLADLSAAPGNEAAAVPEPDSKPAQKRPLATIGGVFVGICLCLFILAAINNNRQQNEPAAEAAITAAETAVPPATTAPLPADLPLAAAAVRPLPELEELHQVDPDNIAVTAELAAAYLRAGQREEAISLIQNSFSNARLPLRYILAAERLLEINELDLAAAVIQEGLDKFSSDQRLQHLAVMTAILSQTSADSLQALLGKIKAQPGFDEVSVQIGRAYLAHLAGSAEEALAILEEALQENGRTHHAELLFMAGMMHQAMNQNDQAAQAFAEAKNNDPPLWLAVHIAEQVKTN